MFKCMYTHAEVVQELHFLGFIVSYMQDARRCCTEHTSLSMLNEPKAKREHRDPHIGFTCSCLAQESGYEFVMSLGQPWSAHPGNVNEHRRFDFSLGRMRAHAEQFPTFLTLAAIAVSESRQALETDCHSNTQTTE